MDSRAINPKVRRDIIDFDLDGAARGAVTRFCQERGISRAGFYKIRALADAAGEDRSKALLPAKSGPPVQASKTLPDMEQLLAEERARLIAEGWDCGPLSVRSRLIRAGYQGVPSRATIARVFTRLGLVTPQPKKRPRSSYKRFCYPRANDMWQLDGTQWRLDDPNHTKQVIYQVEDDHSRMVLSWAVDATENGPTAIRVVSDAIRRFGVPVRFLTDNGSAFNLSRKGATAPLERYLKTFGVKTISGRVAKPTTQGKNERIHLTLQKFLEAHRPITTPEHLLDLLGDFADGYNNDRAHQSLGQTRTPAEAWAEAVKADPPPLPEPAQPDPYPAPDNEQPKHRKPHGAYEIGGLLMADRRIDKDGNISIGHCRVHIGKAQAGRETHIAIHPNHFEIFDQDGDCLGIIPRPPASSKRHQLNLYADTIHCG
jgi:transposase InsO family protein